MDQPFFAYMYRLRYIRRWSLMRSTVEENVAEHSYHVALLAHLLCTVGNERFGRSLDTEKAVTMALFHDATEVFTGDIPTPVKHQNSTILSSFRGIEELAAHRLLDMVPEELRHVYAPLIDGKQPADSEVKRFVKAADLLDGYLKCVTELSAGNREFAAAKKQIEQSLEKLELPEIAYFMEHLAPSFEKSLDELMQ